jgi:hypothetical protein
MSNTYDTVLAPWHRYSNTHLFGMTPLPQRATGPPRRSLMGIVRGATRCAARLRNLPTLSVVGVSPSSPLSAHPFRLTPVCGPGPSRVYCTLLWYTTGVTLAPEHTMDPHCTLPVDAYAACGIQASCMIRAHTSDLAATRSTQHSLDRLIGHAVLTRDVTERFSLLDPLEHDCPRGGWDLPARIGLGLRMARQRHQPRIVKCRRERIIPG